MTDGRLVIGTRRYSSWSLRGWLCVRRAGLSVTVETLRLSGTGNTAEIKALSPNGCVPYLEHNGRQMAPVTFLRDFKLFAFLFLYYII